MKDWVLFLLFKRMGILSKASFTEHHLSYCIRTSRFLFVFAVILIDICCHTDIHLKFLLVFAVILIDICCHTDIHLKFLLSY